MTEWSEGYIAEIDYTFGYYQELNPLRINLAFLQAGLAVPQVATACELGFGQGLSANIHAAGSAVEWLGTDFNPAQACFAKELAATCGSNAQFYDQSFSEFCLREDLPDFDYIGLHGIWSWISDENRAIIADFIRRKLKAGGVLYISYNTTPGWSALLPLRDLLTEHAELIGASGGGIVPRINGALEFADQLLAVNPAYGRSNPQIAERLKLMKDQNRNYIAHEYFNRDWKPMSFSRVADWLTPAKVKFACSAHFLDFFDNVNLTQQQQSLVNTLPDTYFRETVRDYIINQQFRRDYWIKGARRLKSLEQMEALRSQRVLLTATRDEISLKQTGAVGEINLSEAV
ncbi:MAG: class I SAM-dependent methyltransferase [Methylomonas sp.]